jgi:alkylation response protein AidB-like acyl-CoA dehydrogenase
MRDGVDFWKTSTAAGAPIIDCRDVGHVLGDVAARIGACRFFCWKTAHHTDQHDYHGEMIGAMCKVHCTELLFAAVFKCMQVVAVNSVDRTHLFEKYLPRSDPSRASAARLAATTQCRPALLLVVHRHSTGAAARPGRAVDGS